MATKQQITSLNQLTRVQRRALEGLDVLPNYTGTVDMRTLRANGHRRDVIDRLCAIGLAFVAADHGDRSHVRFALTDHGRQLLANRGRPEPAQHLTPRPPG